MKQIEKAAIIVAVIFSLVALGVQFLKSDRAPQSFGNIFVGPNAYSSAVTYTSSTLTNSVATSLVPRATSSRSYAQVCFGDNSANSQPVFLFKQATSAGVALNVGHAIYASSTGTSGPKCLRADWDDPYTGQIWGITNATATVWIEYLQN